MTLASVLKDAVSVVNGGKGSVDAVALSAKAAAVSAKVKSDFLAKTRVFGERLGKTLGGDVFEALGKGAKVGASGARTAEQIKLFGYSTEQVKRWGLIGLVLVALYFIWKGVK